MEREFEKILIEKRRKETSEINKAFMSATKSKDILIIILKGHLYLENELTLMLSETLIDEKLIKALSFKQKLDLANSMRIIDDIYGAVNKVNSIRNLYAHKLDYTFDEKNYEDLLATLTKEEKDDFLLEYDEWKTLFYDRTIPEFNFKVQLLLSNIWFSLSTCRDTAKRLIEVRLKEKEVETLKKYIMTSKEE